MSDIKISTNEIIEANKSIAYNLTPEGTTLILAFAGLAGRMGIPLYEFQNILSTINAKQIFLRDNQKYWFHKGIPEAQGGIKGIKTFLEKIIKNISVTRLISIGNSGGGYSAILFGNLLSADEVHAFSPRTFLNPIKRLLTRDRIFKRHYKKVIFNRVMQKEYFDLKKVLLKNQGNTKYHLYYSQFNRLDRIHCERMIKVPNVILHPYQYDKHDLAKYLKDKGELKIIMKKISDNIT